MSQSIEISDSPPTIKQLYPAEYEPNNSSQEFRHKDEANFSIKNRSVKLKNAAAAFPAQNGSSFIGEKAVAEVAAIKL